MIKRGNQRKETAFERKLKDIEREKRRVQNEIKSLSRALKKGELPPPASSAPRVPLRQRPAPVQERKPTASSSEKQAPQEASGELFAWSKDKEPEQPRKEEQGKKPLASPLVAEKKKPIHGDERFSNYFSAGGFHSPMPAPQNRSIQRNKAIFMIVLVIVVGYIIFTVLVR